MNLFGINRRRVSEAVKELSSAMDRLGKGDFTVRLEEPQDEFEPLYRSFNSMVSSLKSILNATFTSSSDLTDKTILMMDISYGIEKDIEKLYQNISSLSASSEEFSMIVRQNAQNIVEAKSIVENMLDTFRESQKTLGDLIESMKDIHTVIAKYGEIIKELSSSVARIGEITEAINSIAEQTTLLALNAAIEAARAGEAGRGFAVVADEVRKLAERTAQSTQDIIGIIENIDRSTKRAVDLINRIYEAVESGMKVSDMASEAVSVLAERVREVEQRISALATAGEEEAKAASQLAESVMDINRLADQEKERAKRLKSIANDTVDKLKALLNDMQRLQLDTFSIEKAKIAHNMWKLKLLKFVEGEMEIDPSELVDHTQCYLGKWYYSEGKKHCGHLKTFQDIEPPHIELHKLAKEIYELVKSGRQKEAKDLLVKVKEVAEDIVLGLDKLKHECGGG